MTGHPHADTFRSNIIGSCWEQQFVFDTQLANQREPWKCVPQNGGNGYAMYQLLLSLSFCSLTVGPTEAKYRMCPSEPSHFLSDGAPISDPNLEAPSQSGAGGAAYKRYHVNVAQQHRTDSELRMLYRHFIVMIN